MTAVEWLEKEIENISIQVFDGFLTFREFMEEREELCKQAKEMEKQQIIETCADWWNEGASYMYDGKRNYLSFEQYYNEKFKK